MRTNIRVTLRDEDAVIFGRCLWPLLLLALFKLVIIRAPELADAHDPEYRVSSESRWLAIPASAIESVIEVNTDAA